MLNITILKRLKRHVIFLSYIYYFFTLTNIFMSIKFLDMLFNFFLTSSKSTRQISCWNSAAETGRIRMVCYWVKSCLTPILSHWIVCSNMSTTCHAGMPSCHDWGLTVTVSLSGQWWRGRNLIMSGVMLPNKNKATHTHPTMESRCTLSCLISCRVMTCVKAYYKKTNKYVVGVFEEHMSGTTNTTYILFKNCVTYYE